VFLNFFFFVCAISFWFSTNALIITIFSSTKVYLFDKLRRVKNKKYYFLISEKQNKKIGKTKKFKNRYCFFVVIQKALILETPNIRLLLKIVFITKYTSTQ